MSRSLRFAMIGVIFSWFFVPSLVFAIDNAYIDSLTQGNDHSGGGAFTENVDPYSGNLTIAHTDIFLPGNSGLDLKIIRVYNSAIWGRRNVPSPGVVRIPEQTDH